MSSLIKGILWISVGVGIGIVNPSIGAVIIVIGMAVGLEDF